MLVTVNHVSTPASPMDSVLTASGLDEKGRTVTFAGDTRQMREVAALVEEHGELDCEVESWQILSVVEPEPEPVQFAPQTVVPMGQTALFEVVGKGEVASCG